ncbi:MAG: hypothetical protein JF570_07630 [Caulobacter sp.]|nr:hypothetical protein [Caulobacter sp.]
MHARPSTSAGPTLHERGRALFVKRRLRWLMAAAAVANLVLWTLVFGLSSAT